MKMVWGTSWDRDGEDGGDVSGLFISSKEEEKRKEKRGEEGKIAKSK